jgi:hypothetical protein
MTKIKTVILFGAVMVVAVIAATAGAKWFLTARSSATPELRKLYGGSEGFAVLQKAERIEAFRLNHNYRAGQEPTVTEGPITVSQPVAQQLISVLSAHEAYGWNYAKGCIPVWGVRLSFYHGADRVDILLCFQCNLLLVSLNGTQTTGDVEDFDPIRPQLVQAMKAIFPNDQVIQNLPEIR